MHRSLRWMTSVLPVLPAALFLALPQARCGSQVDQKAVEASSAKAWVGKKAKGFALPGIDGKQVDISADLGKRPILLVFYRGVW